jgi:hypothetical protein
MIDEKLTTEEVLTKLDQISAKGRFISIGLTAFLLSILGVVAYLTYQATTNLISLNKQIADRTKQIDDAKTLLNSENPCDDAKIENVKNILATSNTNTVIVGTPNPNNRPAIQKTPIVTTPKPTVTQTTNVSTTITNPTPIPAISPAPNSKFEVYVQISAESQRAPVRELSAKLTNDKFKFQPSEFIDRKISKNQIIYFRPEDKTAAQELASKIGHQAIIVYSTLKQKKGVLEVWFSNDTFSNNSDVKQAEPKK